MNKNFKIIVEYDGSQFHGWQRQKKDRTVQGEIEKALGRITRERIVINGSGRTDAGVHALAQVANFKCPTHHSAEIFEKALNSLLPKGIVVSSCREVLESFHARFDAKYKTYHYKILNRQLPCAIGRQYVWHIRKPLNLAEMKKAAQYILGLQDFKAFEGSGSPRSTTERYVLQADFQREEDLIIFKISADGFLRFMVRNIIGTLVDVGLGKISENRFKDILSSKDRRWASATAPPQGLFLVEVVY